MAQEHRQTPATNSTSIPTAIAQSLAADDPAVWRDGLKQLHDLAAHHPRDIQANLRNHWLAPLLQHQLYDDIETLAVKGILASPPNSNGVAQMEECRARAFLAAQQYEQALSAAKTWYDLCALDKTGDAIVLLGQALTKAREAKDPGIVVQFKRQQDAGAVVPKDLDKPMSLPSALGENVLKTIPSDAAPFSQRLKSYDAMRDSFWTCTGHGNMLLISGRASEARGQFELALRLADESQLGFALENVARAIRAEDGAIGRANGYILKLRSSAPEKVSAARH